MALLTLAGLGLALVEQPQLSALLLALGFGLFFAADDFAYHKPVCLNEFYGCGWPRLFGFTFFGSTGLVSIIIFFLGVDALGGLGDSTDVAVGDSSLAPTCANREDAGSSPG